ncbi:MAG: ATP-grasp domain-containing protein [Lachnospiraceae bacterium]|nr:ATP-grasp domain-containing protein [Lachnospiraceae bacterium]
MRVGIVYGGTSSEAEASRKNAMAVEAALKTEGYAVCMLEYQQNMIETIRKSYIDIVYLCVQGKHHGDGTLQAMLTHEQIPYTGSGAETAMVMNNKILCKLLFEYYAIPTPKWKILHKDAFCQGGFDFNEIGFPFVAKAPSQGGSYGIELVRTPADLDRLDKVFCYDDPILLEEYVEGKFYTVGLLERAGRLVTLKCVEGVAPASKEMILFTGAYDIAVPKLAESCLDEMEMLAGNIFRYIGARDVARVDFMVSDRTQRPYMLEMNAVPGLKRDSLLPKAAVYSGMRYEDVISGILISAWGRRADPKCLKT